MKVKERIEELRPFCPENTDYDWCKSNIFIAKAVNRLWDTLGCISYPSTEHDHMQLKKYKYAKQKLFDYIKENVQTIMELTIEEKDDLYHTILLNGVLFFEREG